MACMRGDLTRGYAYLDRVDFSMFRRFPYSLAGVMCYTWGHDAALLGGDRDRAVWYYQELLEYPVWGRWREKLEEKVLTGLVNAAAVVDGNLPPKIQDAADDPGERFTPVVRMQYSDFPGTGGV